MFFILSRLLRPDSWLSYGCSYIQPTLIFSYLYLITFRKLLFPVKKVITDPLSEYIQQKKSAFVKLFQDLKNEDPAFNGNIDKIFYLKKEYDALMGQANSLETEWKTRLLMETTPRGNILMYYDPYKMGFTYYSDSKGHSYSLLNAIAMKYVTIFNCRDFYFDNTLDKISSPLAKLHLEEEKKTDKKNDKEKQKLKSAMKDGPFVKFKKHSQETTRKKDDDKKDVVDNKPTKPIYKNKFIHMGKITHFRVLNPPPTKKKNMAFSSPYLDDLSQESELQNQVMSYKAFKSKLTQ